MRGYLYLPEPTEYDMTRRVSHFFSCQKSLQATSRRLLTNQVGYDCSMLASPTKGTMLNRYTRRHLICHWSDRSLLDSAKAGQLDVFPWLSHGFCSAKESIRVFGSASFFDRTTSRSQTDSRWSWAGFLPGGRTIVPLCSTIRVLEFNCPEDTVQRWLPRHTRTPLSARDTKRREKRVHGRKVMIVGV